MRVVIIEDELLVQEEFARLIRKLFFDLEIVQMLSSVSESIEWLSLNKADLIFMDIHLSDGTGFDILHEVNLSTPVIFTTAFDQYAIKAFEANGIGYLLKPINEKDLYSAVQRARVQVGQKSDLDHITERLNINKEYKRRILIKSGDRYSYVAITDVAYFYAEDRVTFMISNQGKRYIVDYTIEVLETLLNPVYFFRLTRGCMASINSIGSASKYFNGRLKITLNPEHKDSIIISRARVADFLKWMDGL